MDYASDIDSDDDVDGRRRQRGGLSFLIVLVGTVCLVAAWILSAGDPYGDLANRVVEVRTDPPKAAEEAPDGPIGLLPDEGAGAEAPMGLLPDEEQAGATAAESASFRQMLGSLPKPGGSHPAEVDRTVALRPVESSVAERGSDPTASAGGEPMTVPVEEFAGPPAEGGEVELTRAQRRAVQRRLGMAGHDAGGTDGVFGPRTREAVAAYQEQSNLAATGEIDQATLEALHAETDADYAAWAEARRASSASRRSASDETTVAASDDTQADVGCDGIDCALGDNPRDMFGGGPRGGAGFQPGADR